MTTTCIICPAYGYSTARTPDWPPACESCRARLRRELGEIPDLMALVPELLEPGAGSGQARVSGGEVEAPLPVRLEALDLLGGGAGAVRGDLAPRVPVTRSEPITLLVPDGSRLRESRVKLRVPVLDEYGHPVTRPADDQVGDLPPAYLLEQWAMDWRDTLRLDVARPDSTVTAATQFLLRWLDKATDEHDAIDEFAADVRAMHARLTRVVGRRDNLSFVGRCARKVDSARCDTALYVEPRITVAQCGRCGTEWPKTRWLALLPSEEAKAS